MTEQNLITPPSMFVGHEMESFGAKTSQQHSKSTANACKNPDIIDIPALLGDTIIQVD